MRPNGSHMPEVYADTRLTIELIGPLGSLVNNAYIVRPRDGGPAVLIDAPEGSEALLGILDATDTEVCAIVITHSHRDHWAGLDILRTDTDVPVYLHVDEANLDRLGVTGGVEPLAHGGLIAGGLLRVLHTPGHTPGSICLVADGDSGAGAVLTGDTLFPGGPGYTRTPETLAEEIASITRELHTLPDATLVLPGHGVRTTIGAARAEYAVFSTKAHADDLHGDVLWATS